MNWKFTRKLMPVRFEVDEPICMIVPQRRAELESSPPSSGASSLDEELQRKYELFLAHVTTKHGGVPGGGEWQGDYTRAGTGTARPGRRSPDSPSSSSFPSTRPESAH